jgi:hypothetical protein
MAAITKGKTFTATELVTADSLHKLVDDASIANIVDADVSASAAIASSKLDLTVYDATIKAYIDGVSVLPDGTVNPTNLISNGNFESWSAGASAAPDGWTLSGAGASVAREASTIKIGTYSAKVTRSGAQTYLGKAIHTDKGIAYWKGRTVTLGMWVYATVADRAKIEITDGVGGGASTFHTGDSTWQWLTATRTIDASADQLTLYCSVLTADTSAYFDGAMCVEGSSAFAFSPKPAEYLEGTWTMGVSFGGGTTGITYNAGYTTGRYTKIGRLVHLEGYLSLSNKGSSTGNAIITGLPFAAATGNSYYSVPSLALINISFANQYYGTINSAGTAILLQEVTEAGSVTTLTDANFANNSEIMISATYISAA